MKKFQACLAFSALLSGCLPGTYEDPFDDYVRGLRCFDRGNYAMALMWWEALAKEGDCDAEFRLGSLYFLGAGVTQSDETALSWWRTAGNEGQPLAQATLAAVFARDTIEIHTARVVVFDCSQGCGVDKNMAEAYRWALLAERCAVRDEQREFVKGKLVKYGQSLTPDQIADAERQAREWEPSPTQCTPRNLW